MIAIYLIHRFKMIFTRNHDVLKDLPRFQLERLNHIDFRLYFLGELGRSDITKRFETAPAGATRDIALYREIAPDNMQFDGSTKLYKPTVSFKPIFNHSPERALIALSLGIGDVNFREPTSLVRCEFPTSLSVPKVDVLASLTRAIHTKRPVLLKYCSITSGLSEREIVPFALVDTGLRWHVRAFDRKSNTFRDFVLTRMLEIQILDNGITNNEVPENDTQWSRIIELELIPHPNHARPEAVRMDFDIENDEVLAVRARAATVGYVLRRWNIDCSPDHRLIGPEYLLWLRDPLSLYGAETAILAPGYQRPQ